MSSIVVGLDGSPEGEKALAHARSLVRHQDGTRIVLAFVIEWTPYSFHTPDELAERHRRREQEIEQARAHVLDPAAKALEAEGFTIDTEVRHGDPADLLDAIARENGAQAIIVARVGQRGLRQRIFGGVTGKLVAHASVPVTVVP
jgi:nucleotide-binding universal stress UspA family protein